MDTLPIFCSPRLWVLIYHELNRTSWLVSLCRKFRALCQGCGFNSSPRVYTQLWDLWWPFSFNCCSLLWLCMAVLFPYPGDFPFLLLNFLVYCQRLKVIFHPLFLCFLWKDRGFCNTSVQHIDRKSLFNLYVHHNTKIAFTKIIHSLHIISNDCFSVITWYNLSTAFHTTEYSLLDTLPYASLRLCSPGFPPTYVYLTGPSQSPFLVPFLLTDHLSSLGFCPMPFNFLSQSPLSWYVLFIHPLNKYSLSIYFVPGWVAGTRQ